MMMHGLTNFKVIKYIVPVRYNVSMKQM